MSFLLTCLLRGMTNATLFIPWYIQVSTHMPLARHDFIYLALAGTCRVSTHMPLARHDDVCMTRRSPCVRFLLTCLLRGMTSVRKSPSWHDFVFLLTCLLRGMTLFRILILHVTEFLLTCLLRGMTGDTPLSNRTKKFLLTCLLRGMTSVSIR